MKSLKQGLLYFITVMVYAIILFCEIRFEDYLINSALRPNEVNFNLIVFAVVPIVFGALLAVPKIVFDFKKEGKWIIDWVKIISITFPTLLFSFISYIHFNTGISYLFPTHYLTEGHAMPFQFSFASGIVCGYSLVKLIRKQL